MYYVYDNIVPILSRIIYFCKPNYQYHVEITSSPEKC